MLRTAGKRVFFVTNNASKSRQGNLEKFTKLGIHATHEEVICSSFAAALYLSNIGFQATGKKVYVVGASGPGEELDLVGIPHLGGPEDGSQTIDLKNQKDVVIDPNVGAVVVGFDPMFNYYKLQYAQLCLNGDPQCLFIATNEDAVGHFTPNQEWAGAGSMVGALKGCTHRSPIVVGKPNSVIVEYIVNKYNLSPARMCMVGDRLDTDILFGRNHGMRTCLTLSGVTSIEKVTSEENNTHPDFMVNSLQDFVC
jgi:phosphoglycolate/pyridoxal phosphate phosphatase family enzyme